MNAATYRNLICNYIRETNLSLETAGTKQTLNLALWGCLALVIIIAALLIVKIVF